MHYPSLVFYILILLVVLSSLLFSSFTALLNRLYVNPWVFSVFSPSPSLWQWGSSCCGAEVHLGLNHDIHVRDTNQYFNIICEIPLRSFISPKVNGKVEGWAWSNHPFQYKKYCKKLLTIFPQYFGAHLQCFARDNCTWLSATLSTCSSPHHEFSCADGNACDWPAVAKGRRCQKGTQSPISFSLLAYSALPPHPQLLPKELHFCTLGPLILIYATA